MASKERRGSQERRPRRDRQQLPGDCIEFSRPRSTRSKKPIKPLTERQALYMNSISSYDLVFAKGPAGTGKTWIAAAMAAEAMASKKITRIIITRPAVGAEEEYGFLPGELDEKIAPWARPVIAVLEERLGAGAVEYLLKNGDIEIAPLGMLRGHTFNDAWVLLDEAQNTTPSQMKLFLTRFGQNAKMIVDGDLDQKDIPGPSGFADAMERLDGHQRIGFVSFDIDDIVRSGLCRDILIRYAQKKGAAVGQEQLDFILDRG